MKIVFLPLDRSNNNPYQRSLVQHLTDLDVDIEGGSAGSFFLHSALMQWKPDVIHLHWLHSYFTRSSLLKSLISAVLFLSELVILKLIGVKIVWTVHNLKNHNNKHLQIDRICTAAVARIAHGIIAHCEVAKQEIITTFNLKNADKIFVVPHGNYIGCYENKLSQTEARQALGISESEVVLLFLGLIRPYKGVIELIDTFDQISHNDAQLIIAGKVWNDSLEQAGLLEQRASANKKIRFIPGFVPDDRIQLYMNACDVVVFPYRDILTSGAVLLAMSFGRACIAPRIGCIAEVLDNTGSFLYNPGEKEGLSQAMSLSVQKKAELIWMGKHNQQLAEQYDWKRIAEMTLKVYQICLGK